MDKQTEMLESEALQKPDRAPRGMLGRIRKATGDFDFSALISGSRRAAAPRPGTPPPGPSAYTPVDDTVPALAKLWEAPPEAPADDGPVQVPEWERAKPLPKRSNRPYSTIYEPIDDEPAYVRNARSRGRHRRRTSYGRALFMRTLLCIWAVLFGACLGAGGGPLAEKLSSYRALPASTLHSIAAKAAKPASKAAAGRRNATNRRSKRPASGRHAATASTAGPASTAQKPDQWQPYRDLLTVPLGALAIVGLLWVLGLPDLFGDFDNSGYWALALATFGLAAWCGLLAMMATLEIRSVLPASPPARAAAAPQLTPSRLA